ncbi:hypothetical protein J2X46_002807 [Nocardioides sp. BE266]|uniref:DUF4397 domain-containing protein n=1 Tax=Nocardioides sp. BE266 TaxID=2817725 RepID=UPI002860F803|nr:DUF4397 domain-containing protein [Nocardioides sp. BE266]MDR7253817.1 hypothetical protein [Nocardioides sp. BE266]
MRRLLPPFLAASLALLALAPAAPVTGAPNPALVTVIQAVPDATVDVTIDGRSVATGAGIGDVLGPFDLAPGDHDVSFAGDGVAVDTSISVDAGAASDVVLHLPADVGGDPVVHSYDAPTGKIGPDKARVLLAHTATVAPADVEVNGETFFTNIANGEYADADVPAGTIKVALLPSGTTEDPILGPLDVALKAETLSMIYAYGNPRDGSMSAIAHVEDLSPDGSVRPTRIDTGSAGLVDEPVTTFGDDSGAARTALALAALGVLLAAGAVVVRRRSRPDGATPPV